MEPAVFGVVAAIAVASALGLVVRRNPIHGALFLVVHLGAVAVLFLMLGAVFLAAIQVIVYAGAIMVLFIFAINVLVPGKVETGPDPLRAHRLLALPLGALLLFQIALTLRPGALEGPRAPAPAPGGIEAVGRLLLGEYLLPFEITAVLLLVALIGVLALAKRRAG
jgi:NADH-quinone oxidoreductase subunit J